MTKEEGHETRVVMLLACDAKRPDPCETEAYYYGSNKDTLWADAQREGWTKWDWPLGTAVLCPGHSSLACEVCGSRFVTVRDSGTYCHRHTPHVRPGENGPASPHA